MRESEERRKGENGEEYVLAERGEVELSDPEMWQQLLNSFNVIF